MRPSFKPQVTRTSSSIQRSGTVFSLGLTLPLFDNEAHPGDGPAVHLSNEKRSITNHRGETRTRFPQTTSTPNFLRFSRF